MKKAFSILLMTLLAGCSVLKINNKADNEQNGNAFTLNGQSINSKNNELIISGDSISLEFNVLPYNTETKEWHAAQIAVTANEANLKYFQEGKITNNNPFYSPGRGIATGVSNTYECMYVRNSGHHYILYESDSHKRATLIRKCKNGKVRLKWSVNCFSIDKKEIQLKDSKLERLYVMIFVDYNLNKTIEKDEYRLFSIKLKK